MPSETCSAGRSSSIRTGPLERRLRKTLMQYSSPVMKFRYSENRSTGARTNISSGLVSDSEMTWGVCPAMTLWSSRLASGQLEMAEWIHEDGGNDRRETG